ncbi:ribonuclease P protein component [bacterium B17]|nr:ribonuclease P protein component [bacterium B17]
MSRIPANGGQSEIIPPREDRPDRRLTSEQRISHTSVFSEAFSQKRSFAGKFLVMWLRSGDDAGLRLGVIASKRTFRRAVERNRAKRLMREAYRLNRFRLCGSNDVILIGRRKILDVGLKEVEADLLKLAAKAGVLSEKD